MLHLLILRVKFLKRGKKPEGTRHELLMFTIEGVLLWVCEARELATDNERLVVKHN